MAAADGWLAASLGPAGWWQTLLGVGAGEFVTTDHVCSLDLLCVRRAYLGLPAKKLSL